MPRPNLIAAREAKDMSQLDLAKAVGTGRSTISEWERGSKSPYAHSRRLIRAALQNQDPELFALVDEPNKKQDPPPIEEVIQSHSLSLLKQERLNRGWSRSDVERFTDGLISPVSLERWEHNKNWPNWRTIEVLSHLYQKTPQELGLAKRHLLADSQIPPCQTEPSSDILDSSDSHPLGIPESEGELFDMDTGRRNINGTIATGIIAASTGVALVSSTRILTAPTVEADVYLDLAKSRVPVWWSWLNSGNYHELETALIKHVPTLKQLATTRSPFQKEAASLAVESKIMQAFLANHSMQFSARETYCYQAIQFAALSDDNNLLALAQFWYGDTFSYCYDKPLTAIEHLNDALTNVDGNTLVESAIYSGLSLAHAQTGEESISLNYANMARSTMPSNPHLDHLYECTTIGPSELMQLEGRSNLYLSEHLHSKSYAEKAYALFDKSTSQRASSKGYQIQALIRKADAARVLDDKNECVNCLAQCLELTPSQHKLSQAQDVLGRVPDKWLNETPIKNLQKDVSRALVVAR